MSRPVKVPKPFKRKRGPQKKEYGSYYAKVKGEDINLATTDTDEAIRRAREAAVNGKRNFQDEATAAANAALEARSKAPPATPAADVAAAAAASPPPLAPPPVAGPAPLPPTAPAAAPPAAPPAASAATQTPPPASPPENPPSPPPPPTESVPPHEAAADAAREATQERDTAPPPPPPAGFALDPALLKMMCAMGAKQIVDLQLIAQGWLVWKRTGERPGQVPKEALAGPTMLWQAQLETWCAKFALDNVPPWLVAMVLTTMCMPIQYAKREKKAPAGSLGTIQDAEWSETTPSNGTTHRAAA